MTPEEVAMTTSHPLCNRDCVATLRNIYTEADGGIVTGKVLHEHELGSCSLDFFVLSLGLQPTKLSCFLQFIVGNLR